jgi:uncharacterized protein (DUF305 family)
MAAGELIAPEAREPAHREPRGYDRATLALALLSIILGVALIATFVFRPHDPGDNSVEAGFARDMSVHHAQAVEMALIVHDRTNDPDLKYLTQDIFISQQDQIGQMEGWLNLWGLSQTGSEPAMSWMGHPVEGLMPGMATPEQVDSLRTLPVDQMNQEFLNLMIAHHQAGIEMAQAALQRSDNEQVKLMAQSIVAAQQGEIQVMQQKLAELQGGQAPATGQATPAASPEASPTHHQ